MQKEKDLTRSFGLAQHQFGDNDIRDGNAIVAVGVYSTEESHVPGADYDVFFQVKSSGDLGDLYDTLEAYFREKLRQRGPNGTVIGVAFLSDENDPLRVNKFLSRHENRWQLEEMLDEVVAKSPVSRAASFADYVMQVIPKGFMEDSRVQPMFDEELFPAQPKKAPVLSWEVSAP